MAKTGEFELIERYFAPIAQHEGAFALLDDAASLSTSPGKELVVTTDAVISDVHFFSDENPKIVAQRAVRVNLSDLAAKGATPVAILLTLALPTTTPETWVKSFAEGLAADCRKFKIALLGGDTVSTSSQIMISITAIGEVEAGKMIKRNGANPGDLLLVTGCIGDAHAGLKIRSKELGDVSGFLEEDDISYLLERYALPRPRVEYINLISNFAKSAMDVSDGLIADVLKLAKAGSHGFNMHLTQVPLSPAMSKLTNQSDDFFSDAIAGGDDYEILFTIDPSFEKEFFEAVKKTNVPATLIGEVTADECFFLDSYGKPVNLSKGGYTHF